MPNPVTCDGSAFVGTWPFTSTGQSLAELLDLYRRLNISRGAVTPLAAILNPEPMTANLWFLQQVRSLPESRGAVFPVPVINPTLPSCSRDLEQCCVNGASAVKIFPGYHDYQLSDERVLGLAGECEKRRLPLSIQVRMEDERSHNPVFRVPAVDVTGIRALVEQRPDLQVVVCGLYMAELFELSGCVTVTADLSFVEAGKLLTRALAVFPADRLMLATHTPLFVAEAGIAKVESEPISSEEADAIRHGTFDRSFEG